MAGDRYRRSRPEAWRDPRFRACSTLEKLLLQYVTTGPQSDAAPGLSYFSAAIAADDLGATVRGVQKALEALVAVGLVTVWDRKAHAILVAEEVAPPAPVLRLVPRRGGS